VNVSYSSRLQTLETLAPNQQQQQELKLQRKRRLQLKRRRLRKRRLQQRLDLPVAHLEVHPVAHLEALQEALQARQEEAAAAQVVDLHLEADLHLVAEVLLAVEVQDQDPQAAAVVHQDQDPRAAMVHQAVEALVQMDPSNLLFLLLMMEMSLLLSNQPLLPLFLLPELPPSSSRRIFRSLGNKIRAFRMDDIK
jgi:hypothetical protein